MISNKIDAIETVLSEIKSAICERETIMEALESLGLSEYYLSAEEDGPYVHLSAAATKAALRVCLAEQEELLESAENRLKGLVIS